MFSLVIFMISAVSEMPFLSYPMEFHVEATGVAHWLSLRVSSPQGGGGGVTVGAGQAHPPRGRLQRRENVRDIKKKEKMHYLFICEKDKTISAAGEFIIHIKHCIASLCGAHEMKEVQ